MKNFLEYIKSLPKKLRFKKRAKSVLTSNISEIHNSFTLRTHIIDNMQTLHLHQSLKKLKQFFSCYHATKKMIFKNTKILNIK